MVATFFDLRCHKLGLDVQAWLDPRNVSETYISHKHVPSIVALDKHVVWMQVPHRVTRVLEGPKQADELLEHRGHLLLVHRTVFNKAFVLP